MHGVPFIVNLKIFNGTRCTYLDIGLLRIPIEPRVTTFDMSELAELTSARYGKAKVRVFRVVRDDKWHHVVEYNVEALLEGDIATR